jgi:hypothetical protein
MSNFRFDTYYIPDISNIKISEIMVFINLQFESDYNEFNFDEMLLKIVYRFVPPKSICNKISYIFNQLFIIDIIQNYQCCGKYCGAFSFDYTFKRFVEFLRNKCQNEDNLEFDYYHAQQKVTLSVRF